MKKFLSILFFFSTLNFFFIEKPLIAESTLDSDVTNIEDEDLNNNQYILGPGDLIRLTLFESKELSGEYVISNDGYLNLPLIGLIEIENLTINQASELLKNKYAQELINPNLFFQVVNPRPIKVSVVGEINRPGLYSLNNKKEISNVSKSFITPNEGLPTVVIAIQKAGGITQEADLNEIIIRRRLPGSFNEFKEAKLDLLSLIRNGDQSQNPYLFDGDIIVVNKSNEITSSIIRDSKSNLSPDKINIYVIGKVNNPRMYTVKANTPLIQALYQAGGPSQFTSNSNVELIRINDNGTVTRKRVRLNTGKPLSNKSNPPLKNGDIIRVKSNVIGTVRGGISVVTEPLSGLINAVTLFKLLN